jgi:purine-binding chemotaxis protein CheW
MKSDDKFEEATEGFVTVVTGGQLFGLPLERVRDVFVPRGLSTVPLAPPEVAGLLNLRGRIVTAIDLRRRLGLPARAEGAIPVAVGIEERGELYGLIVDRVGDVLRLERSTTSPILRLSIHAGARSAPACIGWSTNSWWCLTSTRCSISAGSVLLPNRRLGTALRRKQ